MATERARWSKRRVGLERGARAEGAKEEGFRIGLVC